MNSLVRYFFSSFFLTILSFFVVYFASVTLNANTFSGVVYYLYLIPLVIEISIFGQHYSILKNARKELILNRKWKLERRKLLFSILICFILSFILVSDGGNVFILFLLLLIFISLRLTSSFLRVSGNLFLSIIVERSVQISVSIVFLIFISTNTNNYWIEPIFLLISVIFFIYIQSKCFTFTPIANNSTSAKTDTRYEMNMMLTIGSMLLVKSLDKIIIANYFTSFEFSKFVILFQLYLPFPLIMGFAFQYFIPKFAENEEVVFKKKYAFYSIIMAMFLFFIGSYLCDYIYDFMYKGKYNFQLDEIQLIIVSGLVYALYQPIALIIVSLAKNKELFLLNMLNIISVLSYLAFIAFGVSFNELKLVLIGFLVFWISKLVCGFVVINRVEKFRWA